MNPIKGAFIFLSGAAIGSTVTWLIMNKSKEKIRLENAENTKKAVEQVRKDFMNSKKNQELKTETDNPENVSYDYVEKVKDEVRDYIDNAVMKAETIKLVSAKEFEENEEDDHVYLTYYALDDLVMNPDGTPLDHPENYLGESFRDILAERDPAYIKNDDESTIYELNLDDENSVESVINHNIFEERVNEDVVVYANGIEI